MSYVERLATAIARYFARGERESKVQWLRGLTDAEITGAVLSLGWTFEVLENGIAVMDRSGREWIFRKWTPEGRTVEEIKMEAASK